MQRTNLVRALVAGGLLLFGAGGATAQRQRPDFSGQWALSNTRFNMDINIAQDASTFTVKDAERTLSYKLDESDSQNATVTAAGQTRSFVSHVIWVGNALVLMSGGGMTTYSLNREGNLIVTSLNSTREASTAMESTTRIYARRK